jgi:putative SOS response-associated peptidase YedK
MWFGSRSMRTRRCSLGGLWTEFRGDVASKSKPIPGPHLVYGFLTTASNAVVEPLHPKAMLVILTTQEEYNVWMRASWDEARHCSDRCLMRHCRLSRAEPTKRTEDHSKSWQT